MVCYICVNYETDVFFANIRMYYCVDTILDVETYAETKRRQISCLNILYVASINAQGIQISEICFKLNSKNLRDIFDQRLRM